MTPTDFVRARFANAPQIFGRAIAQNHPKRIRVSTGATAKDGTRLARVYDVSLAAEAAAQRAGFSPTEVEQASLAAWRHAVDLGFSTAGIGRG